MTREEYISVCSKYSDYLNLTGDGCCYIKGAITLLYYQVTGIVYKDFTNDNKVICKIWYKCYSQDKKTIQTNSEFCYAYTKEDFEKYIQIFIENYKKEKVKLKKYELEKDFE